MIEENNFETYLYINSKKFTIYLLDTTNLKNFYKNEINLNENSEIDYQKLNKFLDENIFKIEKLTNKFIENIFLIIEDYDELEINISLKKNNNNNVTNLKTLNQALIEVKDLFRENYQKKNIIHMLINNLKINNENYKIFKENLRSDYIYLEIKFITLSNRFIYNFDKILEKYQIKITKFISANYIKQILRDENAELSIRAHKVKNGINLNEIEIVPKTSKNKGFFEKFFQLFS